MTVYSIPVPRLLLHGGLFLATCATTWYAGGPVFAATLMAILVTHEMGHYVTARKHGIDVSLPYFIPLPFAIGTMGAIIKMRKPIDRRDALVDVGASGPLAGALVAIPLLVIGLVTSDVGPIPRDAPSFQEGNSLLYLLLKLVIKGRILPDGPVDVQLGPMAMAAWVGLLVTFINLIPIGQLDGGHVAYAFFADRPGAYERWAKRLHLGLFAVGLGVAAVLALEARGHGRGALGAIGYGLTGAVPWGMWALLLLLLRRVSGGQYHPPVGTEPLSRSRRVVCLVVAALFLLLFTPVPMREALQ